MQHIVTAWSADGVSQLMVSAAMKLDGSFSTSRWIHNKDLSYLISPPPPYYAHAYIGGAPDISAHGLRAQEARGWGAQRAAVG